jgi:hypothetical protein
MTIVPASFRIFIGGTMVDDRPIARYPPKTWEIDYDPPEDYWFISHSLYYDDGEGLDADRYVIINLPRRVRAERQAHNLYVWLTRHATDSIIPPHDDTAVCAIHWSLSRVATDDGDDIPVAYITSCEMGMERKRIGVFLNRERYDEQIERLLCWLNVIAPEGKINPRKARSRDE